MEDIERVTPTQIETVRKKYTQLSGNADHCPDDLERVKSDSLWIRRFIAAQDGDPDKAAKMLFETCQWRKEFGVNQLDHTNISQSMTEKGTLFIHNKDNWGKDLLIFKAKTHVKGVNDMEEVKKFIVYWFERIERFTKSDQITIVFDMKETGLGNMDMDFIRYLIKLLKEYYPYLVNYLLIYDIPWILKSAWAIIQKLLDKKSVERIKFVDSKQMREYIDAENSLVEWGGTDSYKFSFEPEVRLKNNRKSSLKTLSINNNQSSSEDSSPDGKGRKVQFTDRDGTTDIHSFDVVENTRPEPRQRKAPSPPNQNPPKENSTSSPMTEMRGLIETPDTFVIELNGDELRGDIPIKNLTNELIIFKVKTTATNNYRVKPTIGIVEGGAETFIRVQPTGRVNVRQDRFQIQAGLLPKGIDIGSEESDNGRIIDFQTLNHIWKDSIEPTMPLQTKKIKCILRGQGGVYSEEPTGASSTPVGVGTVTLSQEEMRRGLLDLETKISANLHQMLEAGNKKHQMMLYILIGLVIFFGVLTFFLLPSGCVLSACSGGSPPAGSSSESLPIIPNTTGDSLPPLPPPMPGSPPGEPGIPQIEAGGQAAQGGHPTGQGRTYCVAS